MHQELKVVYFVEPSPIALAERAARHIVQLVQDAVAARGIARIAISGGSTPKAAFALLADPGEECYKRMPWDRVELFWVDERCVPPDDPDSNYGMTREALLDHVPLKPKQIHRIQGELDPNLAAARYETELKNSFKLKGAETPLFDVVQLGMGPDGHTASLFPHTAALDELGRLATANYVEQMKTWRITLTSPVINLAEHVFFLVSGSDKAMILNQVFEGPRDPTRLPSQLIVPAGGILTLLLDRAAATLLPATDADGFGSFVRNE
jgi:6-phosphogluconolactonase